MKKTLSHECLLILPPLLLFLICGCSGSSYSPGDKAQAVSSEDASQDIFNVLEAYSALEACFTTGTMTRKAFEDKLFRDLLADPKIADTVVAILDGLPPLFEPRAVPEGIFQEDVEAEMNNKGPLPDLFSALAALPGFMLSLPDEQKSAFYAYLDLEDAYESSTSGYLRKILYDAFDYFSTCDPATLNMVMDLVINDMPERQAPQDRTIDLSDIDDEINRIVTRDPEGLAQLIQGLSDIMQEKDIRSSLARTLSGIGRMLADAAFYPKNKSMLSALDAGYTKETLGEILERVWTKGAVPGASVEAMAVDGYGKSGKYDNNLRELLTQPAVLNAFIETIASFDRAGFHFDGVDKQLREYIRRDPFLQLRSGPGEFGNGAFYAPTADFSYRNYTGLQGFIDYSTRWGVPLTLTSGFMFENRASGAATQAAIRKMIPTADTIPVAAMVWTDIYEKGAGYTYGHGHPVTEKRGYGMMKNGIFVAPNAPDTLSGAAMALTQVGDALLNGPYDNIYDNLRFVLHERRFFMVIDLVQFVRRIPALDAPLSAYFKTMGITAMPLTLFEMHGITTMMYMDLESLLNAILTQVDLTSLPASYKAMIVDVMEEMMGSPSPGTDKSFLLPQDMRDLWTMVMSLAYYDPAAFHPDRFLDPENNEKYMRYYDISGYSYAQNADHANPIWPLIGALSLGSYIPYKAVVDRYPPSLEYLEARRAAARQAFGGVEIPIQYVVNLAAPLTEQAMENSAYAQADSRVTLLKLLTPLLDAESSGTIDAVFEIVCALGRPSLRESRLRLLNGLAAVAATTQKDSSPSGPYALAGEMLLIPQKARTDERYWEAMRWRMDAGAALLSAEYDVVENLQNLLSSVLKTDLSEADDADLARAMTTLLGRCSEERIFSRCLIDLTDVIKHLNSTHTWGDLSVLMRESMKEDGVAAYLMDGIEKAARYSWERILKDVDAFLHSDLIMRYDLGSFWHALKSMVNFLVDAIE